MGELTERLFVAVPLPAEVRAAVEDWRAPLDLPGRLVPVPNLHLTLRFIGSVDEVGRERITAALDEADLGPSFRILLDGLDGFPSKRRATVAWTAVEGDVEALEALATVVDEAVADAGFEHEERPFRPHLTLARIRPPEDLRPIRVGALRARFRVDEIVLYRSELAGRHVSYTPLEVYPLG